MSIKRRQSLIDQPGIAVNSAAQSVRNIRLVIGQIERPGGVPIEKVVIDGDAAAMGIRSIDAISGIGVEDIVFDINATQRLPENDSLRAIVGDDVIVDFEIADGGVSGDLDAGAAISHHNVIDDRFVSTAEI